MKTKENQSVESLVVCNPDLSAKQTTFCALVARTPKLEIIVTGVFDIDDTYKIMSLIATKNG
jgi:hypothetical protein